MPYIVNKKEGNKRIIIMPFAALYYWLIWPTIIMSLIAWLSNTSGISMLAVLMWIMLVGMGIPYWPINSKLKKTMREKTITATGSKYSLNNPLKYEWEE